VDLAQLTYFPAFASKGKMAEFSAGIQNEHTPNPSLESSQPQKERERRTEWLVSTVIHVRVLWKKYRMYFTQV
jgi:hypothetical protein